ncbi:head GIN domain-containing protein [uncultured Sphingomonas sp.]|uniref:head GIN domain-containing protein n=1 Tax=uncultured Sphingomonas sp. TaxID=158754 RepID=UPI0035CB48AA
MHRFVLTTLFMLAAACSAGASSGTPVAASGGGATRDFSVSGFSAVVLGGSDDVDVRVGPGYSVRAEGDPKLLDQLDIRKDGDTLMIGRKPQTGFGWAADKGARIVVTLPRLAAASTAGSGSLMIDRVQGDRFDARASGSGDLAVASLGVKSLSVDLAGSGKVTLAGSAATGKFSSAGSGDVAGKALRMSSVTINMVGSGTIDAVVNGPADVTMLGSGDVRLTGGARCTTSKIGSGEVSCS